MIAIYQKRLDYSLVGQGKLVSSYLVVLHDASSRRNDVHEQQEQKQSAHPSIVLVHRRTLFSVSSRNSLLYTRSMRHPRS